MPPQVIDVSRVIDEQKLGWFNYKMLIWSFLVVFADGYDIQAASYVGPELVKDWHISRADLAPLFVASMVGILFGASLLGYVADRIGRKKAIIAGALIFGIFSILTAFSTNVPEFITLRIFAGLGLGGVLPLSIVLNAEYAPRRFRATLISIMFAGISIGSASPGPITEWLIPIYGWQIVFVIGGLIPIVVSLCLIFVLPESLKYLVLRADRRAELARLIGKVKPGLVVSRDTTFILSGEETRAKASVLDLFRDGMSLRTCLLWILFMFNQVVLFFIQAWSPTLLSSTGIKHAALATSLYQIGGTAGGISMGWLVDRLGITPIIVFMIVAIPIVAYIGTPGITEALVMVVLFAAGYCMIGVQFGINAISGMVYPTYIRASGVGWSLGMARIGALAGGWIGGWLLANHYSVQHLYFVAATPIAVLIVAGVILARTTSLQRESDLPLQPARATD